MNRSFWSASIAAAAALTLFAAPVVAQDSATVYTIKGSHASAQKSVDAKVEKLVDEMSFYKRPFARGKLKESNKVCQKITITRRGEDVTTQCDAMKSFTTPADGTKKKVIGSDGDSEYVLSQKLSGNKLTQIFRSENGTRTTVYSMNPATGAMSARVSISSSKLPRKLAYTTMYVSQ